MPGELHSRSPEIKVQIVHIEGPRKGEIDECTRSEITIGRLPSSDVMFPKDLRIVSRRHAEIKREGNRFLLVNHSPNGCYVNGQLADSVYLKQGDVIAFAEGGPKVSFLYSVVSSVRPSPTPVSPRRPTPQPAPGRQPLAAPRKPSPAPSSSESGSFTIQYGTSIKSFKQQAVRLGTNASNDFVLDHTRVFGVHAEIFFHEKQYYVRDLTESQSTLLNGNVINTPAPLHENDILTFSEGGPRLKYLGTGRFVEVIQ